MYFLGVCFYVPATVDDLAMALDGLENRIQGRSAVRSALHQTVANEIRFHSMILE